MMGKCRHCGRRFRKGIHHKTTCSLKCREARKRGQNDRWNAVRQLPLYRICVVCGGRFERSHNQVACSPHCRQIRWDAQHRKVAVNWYHRHHATIIIKRWVEGAVPMSIHKPARIEKAFVRYKCDKSLSDVDGCQCVGSKQCMMCMEVIRP